MDEINLTGRQNLFFRPETNAEPALAALNSENNSQLDRLWVADADQITRFAISGSQKSSLGVHERKQSNDAGALDSIGEITLLFRRKAGQTTGKDLSAFSDEFLQQIYILVVDGIAWLDWRKTLLEEGAGHESVTIGKLNELQAHLISLWRVILLSCGQNFISSSLSVVFRRFFSVV